MVILRTLLEKNCAIYMATIQINDTLPSARQINSKTSQIHNLYQNTMYISLLFVINKKET